MMVPSFGVEGVVLDEFEEGDAKGRNGSGVVRVSTEVEAALEVALEADGDVDPDATSKDDGELGGKDEDPDTCEDEGMDSEAVEEDE